MKLKEVEMHYVRSETMWRVRLRPHVLGSVYLQQDDVQPAGLEPRPSAREENVLRVSTPTNRSSYQKKLIKSDSRNLVHYESIYFFF